MQKTFGGKPSLDFTSTASQVIPSTMQVFDDTASLLRFPLRLRFRFCLFLCVMSAVPNHFSRMDPVHSHGITDSSASNHTLPYYFFSKSGAKKEMERICCAILCHWIKREVRMQSHGERKTESGSDKRKLLLDKRSSKNCESC